MAYGTAAAAMAPSATAAWVSACGAAAPVLSSALFLAPMPTIRQVMADRNIGNLPFLPYSSMFVNAFLWMTYGVLKNEAKVILPNAFGFVLGTYYFVQFRRFIPKGATNLPGTVQQHNKFAVYIISLALFLASSSSTTALSTLVPKEAATNFIGKLGVTICVILFASPLSAMKTVIATKSAKSIPLPFTIACMMNCFCWSVMGLFKMKDFNIYFPNLLGLISSLVQVFLKVLYAGNGDGRIIKKGSRELPI